MNIEVLKKELEHFEKIKGELLQTHKGKIALIKGAKLIDTFTTLQEAYREGVKHFGKEPFLIKPIQEPEEEQKIPALTAHLIHADL
ncbi:MAG: hypothetical protein ACE5JU_20580 [Candidatus Binatia bacterium]